MKTKFISSKRNLNLSRVAYVCNQFYAVQVQYDCKNVTFFFVAQTFIFKVSRPIRMFLIQFYCSYLASISTIQHHQNQFYELISNYSINALNKQNIFLRMKLFDFEFIQIHFWNSQWFWMKKKIIIMCAV